MDLDRINDMTRTMKYAELPLYFTPSEPVAVLILVKSAAENIEKRSALRKMYANVEYLKGFNMPLRHAFLVATGQFNGNLPETMRAEIEQWRDIVAMDFVESYSNLTYKTLGGMRWALENCTSFEFLIMIDDDMWLSVKNAIRFLKDPCMYANLTIGSNSPGKNKSLHGFSLSPQEYLYAGDVWGGVKSAPARRTSTMRLKSFILCLKWILFLLIVCIIITKCSAEFF